MFRHIPGFLEFRPALWWATDNIAWRDERRGVRVSWLALFTADDWKRCLTNCLKWGTKTRHETADICWNQLINCKSIIIAGAWGNIYPDCSWWQWRPERLPWLTDSPWPKMLRHNFPPAYYEYHGADPPSSSSTSSNYYGMQYRVSPSNTSKIRSGDDLNHETGISPSSLILFFVLSWAFQ